MRTINWRAALLVALTSSALAASAMAEQSTSGGQSESGATQSSSSNNSSQDQKQATNDKNSTNNNNTSAKQSNQNRDDRSNAAPDRNTSANTRDRDDRDSARSERDDRNRDDRSYNRDRSSRDDDRNADRNDDNRSSNRDRDSSREHASRRDNMRGPDIGIWFSRSSRDGLVISDVSTRGPIAKLGFREGDRIVSVNDRRVVREDEFINFLLRSDARRVKVIVLRDNREETIYVEPAVLLDDRDYVQVDPLERYGIILDDRYDDRIVVWRIIPRSPAYYAGFRAGDVIVTFGGRPYRTRTEFETGSRTWKTGDANVQIRRGDRTRDLSIEIPNVDRRAERSQVGEARTAQREATPSDQGTTNRTEQNSNDQRDNRRGGILNNIRPRANR